MVQSKSDNQQERLEMIGWIAGFVDGEGCFSVSMIQNKTTSLGWQLFPEFVVTQGEKSRTALEVIRNHFECGSIYINRRNDNHKEHLLRYCVRSVNDLRSKILPFFTQHPLRTAKQHDFENFVVLLSLMETGRHKTFEGLKEAAQIIQTMNRKVSSKFLESSETTRQTS